MTWDLLLNNAFAFKSRKLWETFSEDQVFAARLNGELCYISILGQIEEQHGLAVYPGEDAIMRFLRLRRNSERENLEAIVAIYGQEALLCQFSGKDDLTEESQNLIRKYTKTHGISLRGKNAWPVFQRLRPYRVPEEICDEDAAFLEEALDAACRFADIAEADGITVPELDTDAKTVPFLRRDDSACRVEELPLPALPEVDFPEGRDANDVYKTRVKKMRKKGTWACELLLGVMPTSAEGVEGLHYPWKLLTVDLDVDEPVTVQPVRDYENRTDVMLNKLMEAILREKKCPKKILVSDERTEAFLKNWCAEVGISLSREEKTEEMEMLEFSDDLTEGFFGDGEGGMNNLGGLLDILALLPDEDYMNQSHDSLEEERDMLQMMERLFPVSDSVQNKLHAGAERMDRLLDEKTKQTAKKTARRKNTPEKTLVISVSLGAGCYRHIQISDRAVLADLSQAILDAFLFDNDHAHAFFFDNRIYSHKDAYYMRGIDSFTPPTDEVTLGDLSLRVGQKFKYLFDFGDDWVFQCRVLKEMDIITMSPVLVRSKGIAPEQYGGWGWSDEDWDDED